MVDSLVGYMFTYTRALDVISGEELLIKVMSPRVEGKKPNVANISYFHLGYICISFILYDQNL